VYRLIGVDAGLTVFTDLSGTLSQLRRSSALTAPTPSEDRVNIQETTMPADNPDRRMKDMGEKMM
jgi:hypothetical protein